MHCFLIFVLIAVPLVRAYMSPYYWIPTSGDRIHTQAWKGGVSSDNKTFYVCMAPYKNDVIPGMIIPSEGCCRFAYFNQDHHNSICQHEYVLLVAESQTVLKWIKEEGDRLPPGAIVAGVAPTR